MTQAGNDLKKLAQDMHTRVVQEVEDQGIDARTALGRMWTQNLQEQGLVQEVQWCRLDVRGAKGVLIDGWSIQEGDLGKETRRIHLFGVIETGTQAGQDGNEFGATVKRATVEAMLTRMERAAVTLNNSGNFAEESDDDDAEEMAQKLRNAFQKDVELELIVITDGKASTSDFGRSPELGAVQRVLDIAWLQRNSADEGGHSIEFDQGGKGLPCLVADLDDSGEPRILLTSIRGDILARIYTAHRERLMERNVRSYLQARNKVNRGIMKTLQDEPERFLCFNNGISATARSVELDPATGRLIAAEGLQIVNGGQTTATIHAFSKKARSRENLVRVQVQTKITVVPDEELAELVPRISLSSNTQSAIKNSDLQANMDWEIEMERASRSTLVMGPDGTETGWYYERARGSHATMVALQPIREKQWPQLQVLTKADAALMLASWNGNPHLASQGPEKGFLAITKAKAGIEQMTTRREGEAVSLTTASQAMFRRLVALAMLRREVHRYVAEHTRKMRPPVVNYTMAWLGDRQGKLFDPESICRTGLLPAALVEMARQVVPLVDDVIQNQRPESVAHEGEWPKKPACWSVVKDIDLSRRSAREKVSVDSAVKGRPEMAEPERPRTPVERLARLDVAQWHAARRWMTRSTPTVRRKYTIKIEVTINDLGKGKGKDEAFAKQTLALYEELIEAGFRPVKSQQAAD